MITTFRNPAINRVEAATKLRGNRPLVLIFGSRNRWPSMLDIANELKNKISQIEGVGGPIILSGGAGGADTQAIKFARLTGLDCFIFPAYWKNEAGDVMDRG